MAIDKTTEQSIDRMLSGYADEPGREFPHQRLEAILRDDPAAQASYIQWMRVHSLLSQVPHESTGKAVPISTRRQRRLRIATVLTLAGGLLALAVLASLGDRHKELRRGPEVVQSNRQTGNSSPVSLAAPEATLHLLSQITRMTLCSQLRFPTQITSEATQPQLSPGLAFFKHQRSKLHQGYVVQLPPGHQMDIYVNSCAKDANALSIIEIDPQGRITGTKAWLSNLSQGPHSDVRGEGMQCLGEWSIANRLSTNQHYLLVSTSCRRGQTHRNDWIANDVRLEHEERDLLVIGWDDSQASDAVAEADVARRAEAGPKADRDYDDIRAMIQIREQRRIDPDTLVSAEHPIDWWPSRRSPHRQPRFSVGASEQCVAIISSVSRLSLRVKLIDEQSGDVVWEFASQTRQDPADHVEPRPISRVKRLTTPDGEARRYRLAAEYLPRGETGPDAWQPFTAKWILHENQLAGIRLKTDADQDEGDRSFLLHLRWLPQPTEVQLMPPRRNLSID